MALDLLFPHFDELIRKPEDVQRLNEAILQLAVQGKLVAQDPSDEPASELLKRIEAQMRRLVQERKIKKAEPLPTIRSDEMPFPLPSGWEWVRLAKIGYTQTGTTPSKSVAEYYGSDFPFLKPADLSERSIFSVNYDNEGLSVSGMEVGRRIEPDSTLMVCIGGSISKVGYVNRDCSCNQQINSVTPYADTSRVLVAYFLNSPYFRGEVQKRAPQTTLPILSKGKWEAIPIPFPPVAEQHRIVARVDELFIQTRALEAKLRQAQVDVVTVNRAALHRLHTAQDDDLFQAAWRTIRDHFDVLYDDPRNVAELRQTILDLAVHGKLVPQDSNDEPAEELLRRISGNRSRDLGKKSSSTPPYEAIKSEVPYGLPVSWSWARFIAVADIATNSTDPGLFPDLPHIAPDNIEKFTGRLLAYRTVAEDGVSSVNHHFFPGQILYSKIRPNLSKAVMIGFEGLCSADMYPIQPLIDARYLHLYILSSVFLSTVTRTDTRVAMPKINQEALSKVPVAVPPLAEQQRIVAKVDQLMRLCDELEAGLAQTEMVRRSVTVAALQAV